MTKSPVIRTSSAVEAVRVEESLLADFFENASIGLHWVGPDGTILWANKAELEMLGYARDEYVGHHIAEFHADQAAIADILQRLTANEVLLNYEAPLRCKDGSIRHVLISSSVLRKEGEFIHTRCFTKDITERRRVDRHLAAQYAVTRALADASTVNDAAPRVLQTICETLDWSVGILWLVDATGRRLRCAAVWRDPAISDGDFDESTLSISFAPGEGLPGRAWARREMVALSDLAGARQMPRAGLAQRYGLHGAVAFPVVVDGAVAAVVECISDEVRTPTPDALELLTAITTQLGQYIERRRIEAQARASEARKAAIVETALDCVIGMDHEGRIIKWNRAAEETFGYARHEVLGREMAEVIVPQALRAQHRAGLAHYLATGEGRILGRRIELTALRRDGTEFPVELSISRVPVEGQPIFTGFLRDITERRWVEQERERLLREAEEGVRARDEFLAIAAHELRTPLTSLQLQVQSLMREAQREASLAETVSTRFEVVERSIHRLARLVNELLDVSRITADRLELHAEEVDLASLVRDVVARVEPEAQRAKCTVSVDTPDTVVGHWDRSRLEQVATNLFSNAVKYGAGKPIEVRVEARGENARLVVRDHGIGIAPEHQARIFERFERAVSERNYSGFGLGLWIARQLVERMGGVIQVASTPDEGSTFTVDLPRAGATIES